MPTAIEKIVESLYIGYFGRAGDPDGFEYWNYQIGQGLMDLNQVAASFSVQPEAKAMYAFLSGTSGDASAFVDQVYLNLFNRMPDAEGKSYWLDFLNDAANPNAIGTFIVAVINGAIGEDVAIINNKIAAAYNFTSEISDAHLDVDVFVNGQQVLSQDFLAASRDAVDSDVTADPATVQQAADETSEYLQDQVETIIVEVPVIVEVPGETVYVPVPGDTVYVPVPGETVYVPVPGDTVYVPTEPQHQVTFFLNQDLPLHSTKNYAGVELGFGDGNLPTNFSYVVDETAGILMGLKAHYRTGDDVVGVAGTGGADVAWQMPKGAQSGTIGNEDGANPNRSHVSIDIVLDFGVGKPDDGEVILLIDNDPTAATNLLVFTLTETAPGSWKLLNEAGTDGQGLTVSNDGHVLVDSTNFGFGFLEMPHGPSGTGDVPAGQYDVQLLYLVGLTPVAELHGQVFLS